MHKRARSRDARKRARTVSQVLLFANLLNVLAPFRFFGGLMVTLHTMLGGDVPRFMVPRLAASSPPLNSTLTSSFVSLPLLQLSHSLCVCVCVCVSSLSFHPSLSSSLSPCQSITLCYHDPARLFVDALKNFKMR